MNEKSLRKSTLKYRPDVDGLRALAVLSVLGCHLQLSGMAGGYVGVDVFFVISGYLISSIMFAEIAASRFSILSFYERRIRRIFPALFAMLMAFTIFACIYFLPVELINYSKSLLAATVSLSNFYFWMHSGYFDSPTSNPLLHTWSLAVEEQFYISFPLFLVLIRKFLPRHLRASVIALFSLSLLTSAIVVQLDRDTAFYMPYTRAWELLLGTMLSLKLFPALRSYWLRNLGTIVGILMIVYGVVRYNASTMFPGFAALVPCLGSALIIGAGESGPSLVGAALSWRPVVFVGLISYSLYLWHWPVIVLNKMGILFAMESTLPSRYSGLLSVSRYNVIVDTVASLVLAVASWRFVERPFRNGSMRLVGKPLFALAATVMILFVALSSTTIFAGGFKDRFSPRSIELGSYLNNQTAADQMRGGTCFITTKDRFENYNSALCLHIEDDKRNYLLLGDSHSAMLWAALSSSSPGANIMQASTSVCGPFVHPSGNSDCGKMMKYIYQEYLPSHHIQGLLLEKRWQSRDLPGLIETLEWAKQHQVPVILLGPIPEYDAPLPRLEAYSAEWHEPQLVSQHRVKGIQQVDEELSSLAASWHIPYVSLYRSICDDDNCTEYADANRMVPLMFDTDHLSPAGSLLIIHHLIDRGENPLSLNDHLSLLDPN
jgi:peptidoglycan/LPS O-acetylase OafA/YrhL